MKKLSTISVFSVLALGLFISSCGKKENKDETQTTQETEQPKECVYTYHKDSTALRWTAFKYTEKVGVSGKFTEFTVAYDSSAKDPDSILKSLEMTVYTSSVNSNNPDRDAKIQKYFFGSLQDSTVMEGSVKAVQGNDVTIAFKLNGVEKEFKGDYSIEDNTLKVKAVIDVAEWNATAGIDALNEVCKDLHTGNDGVSKLWPEVKLSFETRLRKTCQ